MKKFWLVLALAFLVAGASATSASAAYPTKPVEMTITFKAGGAADISGRTVAKAAEKVFGQPIVAVNRPGAGGTIGFAYVKTAPPSGYKIGWLSASILTGTNMGKLPYDYRAWDYVSRVVFEATAIVVRGDSPYKTLPELVKAAKSKTLKIGSAGAGSFTRLTASALAKKAGFKFRHIPLGKRRVPSLLGGEVDAISVHPPEVLALHKAGKVRMLAVSFPKRHPAYPKGSPVQRTWVGRRFLSVPGSACSQGNARRGGSEDPQGFRGGCQGSESPGHRREKWFLGLLHGAGQIPGLRGQAERSDQGDRRFAGSG